MLVEIVSVGQDIDLKTGVSSFHAILQLASGRSMVVHVAPDDAQVLLVGSSDSLSSSLFKEQPTEFKQEVPNWVRTAAPIAPTAPDLPTDAFVFGGQDSSVGISLPTESASSLPVSMPKPKRKMITVPKDEYGYPIVPGGNVTVADVTGTPNGEADEEGIGQG